ncbi:MAG: ATP-binding protein [Cyclobacteriaceae bacterium]|nr:ATP-binding protein [Cyclobacteriaceae bacterium]
MPQPNDQDIGNNDYPLIKMNYTPRIVGYFIVGIILTIIFYKEGNDILWGCIIAYSIIWPHLAYFFAKHSKNQKKAELINFYSEAFIGGVWIPILSFSLWPISTIIIAGFANNLSTGGIKLLSKIIPIVILGILISGYFIGFHYVPNFGFWPSFISFLFLLVYVSLLSSTSFNSAKKLVSSRNELKIANDHIKKDYNLANQENIERKKVEKKLIEAIKDLESFAYIVSHDLKAPLRGMSSMVRFIQEDLDEKNKTITSKSFTLLLGRIQRLDDLISGILEYSKIQKIKNSDTSTEVKKIVDEIIKNFDFPPKFNVSTYIEPQIYVGMNEVHLFEIFSNLISNAIKYNRNPKPIIRIGHEEKNDLHHFFVEDNGEGIPDEYKDKIFEMFQKLQSKDEIEGSGIGLSIVKKIVNQNGGEIWIESSPGKNTFFRFTLPKIS